MKKPLFSIIIPVRQINDYVRETKKHLQSQTLKSFETLVITDKVSRQPHPSFKRNLGAKIAKGKYLAFIDDDSYPDKNWLKNALSVFKQSLHTAAVCGPCLIPPRDNVFQKASGLLWSSFLGSGGAGQYRNSCQKPRQVDDYPSVNLIVKRKDFLKIGGFNQNYWPGEDTLLCLDLTQKLKKNIIYHPSIQVFHHRRAILIPHLQQISRYAIHRGHFAKKFPQTSFRLGYLLPSFFSIYLLLLAFLPPIFIVPLIIYVLAMLLTLLVFLFQKNPPVISLLATLSIPITHIYYGLLFLYGFIQKDIHFTAHKVDKMTGKYLGG